jgi:hypothetical protein
MPPGEEASVPACEAYLHALGELTKSLPPVALVASGETSAVISTEI